MFEFDLICNTSNVFLGNLYEIFFAKAYSVKTVNT